MYEVMSVKKGMRKLTALSVAFMMSFALFGTSISAAAVDNDLDLKYVALGDSVSFGLSSVVSLDPVTYQGFADMFNAYLKAVKPPGTTVTFRNLSEIGDDSNDLLEKLLYDDDFQGELGGADVVTINIGANNLLGTMVGAALKAYGYDGDLEELDYNRMYEIIRTRLKAN
jgi:lysophospholipase L1-like esterase